MQRPSLYYRSPLYYFLAASLLENEESEESEEREQSETEENPTLYSMTTQRAKLRKEFNPMHINDTQFKNKYHLNKEAFIFLCEQIRQKTTLKSSSRITLELKVLCALSFYATGLYQRSLEVTEYLSQTAISKCVKEVTNALTTPPILTDFIKLPETRADRDMIKNKFFAKYGFPGVIGCIGGCHFHIFKPDKGIEKQFYCTKNFHSLNVQMICDSECRILNVDAKYGGATLDDFIWENSLANNYMQELHRNDEQVWLLGDSGYPQRPWLMTPITDADDGTPAQKYTVVHEKIRVTIESTFERLKNRWRCLRKERTLRYEPEKCGKIITACCVLHNIAIDFNIPEPEVNAHVLMSVSEHENGTEDDLQEEQ